MVWYVAPLKVLDVIYYECLAEPFQTSDPGLSFFVGLLIAYVNIIQLSANTNNLFSWIIALCIHFQGKMVRTELHIQMHLIKRKCFNLGQTFTKICSWWSWQRFIIDSSNDLVSNKHNLLFELMETRSSVPEKPQHAKVRILWNRSAKNDVINGMCCAWNLR